MLTSKFLKVAALSAIPIAMALGNLSAFAQAYPTKNINVIVPYPAGGALDVPARVIVKEMTATLKQAMPIENIVGAGGTLGLVKGLGAAPDGYTLMVTDIASTILSPMLYKNAKYKAEDFKTVAMLAHADIMLVVRKDLGVNSVDELIALGKKSIAKPLSYCTAGIGSNFHLIAERFNDLAGMKGLHVPYSGFPQCATNLVGQEIDYAFLPIAGPFPGFIENGSIKGLATAGTKPHARFTKAPQLKSIKGFEDFVFNAWSALHVSNKVPNDVVATLNQAAKLAVDSDAFKALVASNGSTSFDAMSPAEANAHYLKEAANYRALAKRVDITD